MAAMGGHHAPDVTVGASGRYAAPEHDHKYEKRLTFLLLGSITSAAVAAPVALFDGASFAGWEGDTNQTWRIQDGVIVGGSLEGNPRNEFLATRKLTRWPSAKESFFHNQGTQRVHGTLSSIPKERVSEGRERRHPVHGPNVRPELEVGALSMNLLSLKLVGTSRGHRAAMSPPAQQRAGWLRSAPFLP